MKRLADSISNYMAKELKYDDEKREILSYGLQVFLGDLAKTISMLVLAYFLNIFITTLVVMISFVFFRRIIGGTHADTYNKCYFVSVLLILLLGKVGEIVDLKFTQITILILIVYILAVIATILWIPAGTEKKMIKNKATRKKIKIETMILLTFWAILISYLNSLELFKYVISSLLGVALAFFFTTPLGYRFMDFKLLKININ
ncbi:accessory gene regulator ArgB-like protein [Maledivibacter halophilus]|uniref:Accessory gene regulator B n=1 Tax=Maledivibacter halophilus TaxID=36842 RepID=A0A1T5IM81_9FIRM|nr:accessory gene regulator B family protein [Maledivibacter halophilus]SKC40314.1 accessory gene regulator B [Maledivibacter halophilus]